MLCARTCQKETLVKGFVVDAWGLVTQKHFSEPELSRLFLSANHWVKTFTLLLLFHLRVFPYWSPISLETLFPSRIGLLAAEGRCHQRKGLSRNDNSPPVVFRFCLLAEASTLGTISDHPSDSNLSLPHALPTITPSPSSLTECISFAPAYFLLFPYCSISSRALSPASCPFPSCPSSTLVFPYVLLFWNLGLVVQPCDSSYSVG